MISAQLRKSLLFCLLPKKSASILSESHFSSSPSLHFFFSTVAGQAPYGHPSNKNFELIASFLKESGFSDTQLEKVLNSKSQQLRMRSASLEKTIKPKFKLFRDFGFSNAQIVKIISGNPSILFYSASRRVYPSLSFLWDLFRDIDGVFKVLGKSGRFFFNGVKKHLSPNIEFLKSRGVPMDRILLLLSFFPRTLLSSTERVKWSVEKVEGLGMDPSSKMFIYCLWAAVSMGIEIWESKMQILMNLGFTESDTSNAFMRTPVALTVSPEKIKRVVEAIVATNRYTIASITRHPSVLCFSLEKRLKPRLRVLQALEKQKLINKWPALVAIYSYNDKKFHEYFIKPYLKVASGITITPSRRGKKEGNKMVETTRNQL